MKTKLMICASVFTMALCTHAIAQVDPKIAKDKNETKAQTSLSEADMKFAVFAADAGIKEVELGQVAQKNASTDRVKKLAEQMVNDHSKANEELKALAVKKNITLPAKMSDKHQKDFEKLINLKGTEFDEAYIEEMIKDHEMVIKAYEKQSEKGNDPELKAWATSKLPTLKHHLEMFEQSSSATK